MFSASSAIEIENETDGGSDKAKSAAAITEP